MMAGDAESGKSVRFSVCTTNYNCAHALSRHLDSVFGQISDMPFEYVVVDSHSTDGGADILREYAADHPNMKVLTKKCIRGVGRQLAFRNTSPSSTHMIQVDTDTLYWPSWGDFVRKYFSTPGFQEKAIQTTWSGIYPRRLLDRVGGWGRFQTYDDFDLWMRLWRIGEMNWYQVELGENLKEEEAFSRWDYRSARYDKWEKLVRMTRSEFDELRISRFRYMDLERVMAENSVDMGLGLEPIKIAVNKPKIGLARRAISYTRRFIELMRE